MSLSLFKGTVSKSVEDAINEFFAGVEFADGISNVDFSIDEMDGNGSSMVVLLSADISELPGVSGTCKMFSGSDVDAVRANVNTYLTANTLNNTNCKIRFTGMDFNSTSQIVVCIISIPVPIPPIP